MKIIVSIVPLTGSMPDGKDMVGVASFEAMTFQSSTLSLVPCAVVYAYFWLHYLHFPFSYN
jgi:hypothetical protein